MKKASDHQQGDRQIQTDEPEPSVLSTLFPSTEDHDPTINRPPSQTDSTTPPPKKKEPSVTNMSLGYGIIKGEDIYQVNHLELAIGEYVDEKHRLEGFIGGGYAMIDDSSELDSSISDAWLYSIGMRYKHFSTPRYTFLGHYFAIGLSYTRLLWTYENAIQLDGESIRNDSLDGLELTAGMGIHLAQTDNFQVGLEVLPSWILWSSYTDEGFDNDVFGNLHMLKFRLTFSYLN